MGNSPSPSRPPKIRSSYVISVGPRLARDERDSRLVAAPVFGWRRTAVLGVVLTLATSLATAAYGEDATRPDDSSAIESIDDALRVKGAVKRHLDELEARVASLKVQYTPSLLDSPIYDIEARIIDARMAYEVGHTDKSCILFHDLLESGALNGHSEREEVRYLLGRSLQQEGYAVSAVETYVGIVQANSPYAGRALGQLVEIALDRRDEPALSRWVDMIRNRTASDPELNYPLGKALYRLGRTADAGGALSRVPVASASYPGARYYLGVMKTAAGDPSGATTEFEAARVAAVAVVELDDNPRDTEMAGSVRDQALLALGRIHSNAGDVSRASEAYSSIDRDSSQFETALLELGWTYANADLFTDARDTLDVLLLVAEDRRLLAEAGILRGQMLVSEGKLDEALDAFDTVAEEFGPLRSELEDVVSSRRRVDEFFSWLLQRRDPTYSMPAPVSKSAQAFLEAEGGLEGVAAVLDTLGKERRDLEEVVAVIDQINGALSNQRGVDLFPKLQAAWVEAMEVENSLILANRNLLDVERALHRIAGQGVPGDLARATDRRRGLEIAFLREVPQSAAEYQERAQAVQSRLDDLRRGALILRQLWKKTAGELSATERWLSEAKLGKGVEPELERRAEQELAAERMLLDEINRQVKALERAIEVESARSGVAEVAEGELGNLKNRILAAQMDEHELLARYRSQLPGSVRNRAEATAEQRDRAWRGFSTVGAVLKSVDQKVEKRVAEFRRVIDAETRLVPSMRRDSARYTSESQTLASTMGVQVFGDARDRVADLVLQADVGLVEAAWRRKVQKSSTIRDVREDFSQRFREVDEAMATTRDETEQLNALEAALNGAVGADSEEASGDDAR